MIKQLKLQANDIMCAANNAICEYVRDIDNQPAEALNLADLGARCVRFCVSDYNDVWYEVVIEEASPDGCKNFNDYITGKLHEAGFARAHSVTEW